MDKGSCTHTSCWGGQHTQCSSDILTAAHWVACTDAVLDRDTSVGENECGSGGVHTRARGIVTNTIMDVRIKVCDVQRRRRGPGDHVVGSVQALNEESSWRFRST